LTQFNETDSLSFTELQHGTMLTEGILKPQLALLVKAKVLLEDEDQYDLNLSKSFPCKMGGIPW
jgi:cullin 1